MRFYFSEFKVARFYQSKSEDKVMEENIYRVKAGSAFEVIDETRNLQYQLFTPDSGVTYDIIDPDGTTVIDGASMTEGATGIWTDTAQSEVAWVLGMYTLITYAEHGGNISIKENKNAFELY
jgi:hypothetical protein